MYKKRVDIKTGFLCNNNCLFCVQADNKCTGNRSFEEIVNNLKECRKNCDSVVFTGGEVTIREDIFDLVSTAKKLGYKTIQIQSNGRMFCKLEFCKKVIQEGANDFALALHGYCKEQHDYLTRAEGSFKQIVKGILNLKSLGASVITNTVVVKQNYRDLPLIAKLLVKLDVDQFQMAFVHAMGNAWKNKDSVVPRMTLAVPYMKKALQIGIDANKRVMTEAVPYCMMEGYESYIAERIIPDTMIRGKDFQNTDDFNKQKKELGKVKFLQCKKCKYNSFCEGVWKDYAEIYGGKEFEAR
jgi:MoaA/NifB/PqqE/SkfB family radical SAM enzyme